MKKMKWSTFLATFLVLAMVCVITPSPANAGKDLDLHGVQSGRVFFDVDLGDAMMLQGYLGAIQYTYNSLLDQGVDADFIVAFRGPAVALLTTTELGANYPVIAGMLQNMSDMGITLEACAISLGGLLGPDYSIVDTVEVVPNTFISSMISQTMKNGYAVIPIM